VQTKELKSMAFLQGGGEMGALIRHFDWASTPVGAPEQWPQSLRTTVSNLLRSKFPMFLWWGDEMIQFYNDAYRPSLGNDGKHPTALGQQAHESWPEAWHIIHPVLDRVRETGEANWMKDQLVPIYRNGKVEDVYWTYSYSPVLDEEGNHAGILAICSETTENVLSFKRLAEGEDSLLFAIEAAELGTWDYNPLTNTFSGNHRLKSWFGLSMDDNINLDLAIDVIDANDRQRVRNAIEKALQYKSGGSYDIEYRIIHPFYQRERVVRAKGRAWFGTDNQCYRFNGTLQDVTEQSLAWQSAEESAQQVRAIIESAPFPIGVYIGREMRITMVNQSIIDVWGKDRSVVGKTYAEVLPELETQAIYEQLDQVFTTGISFHARHQRVDLQIGGQLRTFYFNYSFTPLFNTNGQVYGVMNTAADITDLIEAKQKAEQSEQRFLNLIRSSSVGMVVLLGEKMIVSVVNEAYAGLIGHPVQEMLQQPLFTIIPDQESRFRPLLEGVLHTGEPVYLYDMPYNEGYLNIIYQPYKETDGRIAGVMALCQDVTKQVLAQTKIKEAEERAKLAIAAAELGTFDVDLTTNEIFTSARMDEIFEIPSSQERANYIEALHPDDLVKREKAYEVSFKTGLLEYEARLIRKNGQLRWLRFKGQIFFDDNNTPTKLAGVVQDITDEQLFAQELTRQVKERTMELERSNEELQQFAHVASHDLKEPVRKILMFSNRLQTDFEEQLPGKANEYTKKIERAAQRLYSMIEGVLLYSSLSAADMAAEPVDLNVLLTAIQEDLELVILKKGAVIQSDELPVIEGAQVLLYQLFYNLINNSLKFSRPEITPVISIRSTTKQSFVVITITDNGIGFDQAFARNIFETFTRLHSKDQYEGTGLGLALCKKIVEKHGGTIEAEGSKGQGAKFTIHLPLKSGKTNY
jgi:PAS domain S-box-containing protein